MNLQDIDNIKDAANLLCEKDPKLSYKLFYLALKYKPNGAYLKKMLHVIKKNLA